MAYNANILLGRIIRTFGFEGAVAIKLDKSFLKNIPGMKSVFIEIEGKPVPFFIEWSDYTGGDILRLKFDGYDTIGKINEFCGCRVFLTSGKKQKPGTGVTAFHNFKIFLSGNRLIGTINKVIENPGQWLLQAVTPAGKEILIPFHEDLIISVNKRKKVIMMDLPEGLLEIN